MLGKSALSPQFQWTSELVVVQFERVPDGLVVALAHVQEAGNRGAALNRHKKRRSWDR